jgi:hypothetical protein
MLGGGLRKLTWYQRRDFEDKPGCTGKIICNKKKNYFASSAAGKRKLDKIKLKREGRKPYSHRTSCDRTGYCGRIQLG